MSNKKARCEPGLGGGHTELSSVTHPVAAPVAGICERPHSRVTLTYSPIVFVYGCRWCVAATNATTANALLLVPESAILTSVIAHLRNPLSAQVPQAPKDCCQQYDLDDRNQKKQAYPINLDANALKLVVQNEQVILKTLKLLIVHSIPPQSSRA